VERGWEERKREERRESELGEGVGVEKLR